MIVYRALLCTGVLLSGLTACASGPADSATAAFAAASSTDPAVRQSANTQGPNGKKPVWTVPTEDEVAAEVEQKYLDATRDFVKLRKDGELRFCKRYREIGSSIARINCLSVPEVRTQVDNMNQYRDDMRNKVGKCVMGKGPNGCSGNM